MRFVRLESRLIRIGIKSFNRPHGGFSWFNLRVKIHACVPHRIYVILKLTNKYVKIFLKIRNNNIFRVSIKDTACSNLELVFQLVKPFANIFY